MARITKELKALVERKIMVKINDLVESENLKRQAIELKKHNDGVAGRNQARKAVKDLGIWDAIKKANKILQDAGMKRNRSGFIYRDDTDAMFGANYQVDDEKKRTEDKTSYFSVSFANNVGNATLTRCSLQRDRGVISSDDEQFVELSKQVNDLVDLYDKALVAVSLGSDLEEAKKILFTYGIEL